MDPAPGGPAEPAAAETVFDARHDAGFGPLPIGLGLLSLVAGLVRRGRPTPQ